MVRSGSRKEPETEAADPGTRETADRREPDDERTEPEAPRETERGDQRELGTGELDPKPKHEKGEITREAIEEAEERD